MKYFILVLIFLFPALALAQEPNVGIQKTVELCMSDDAYNAMHEKRNSEPLILSVSQSNDITMAFSVMMTEDGDLYAARHYENGNACIMFVGKDTVIKPGE